MARRRAVGGISGGMKAAKRSERLECQNGREYHTQGGGAMADSVSVSALVVALIGASSGIGGGFFAVPAQPRVGRVAASWGGQGAESDARRSYEYEARKRFYNV